jgi:hypothetical protein
MEKYKTEMADLTTADHAQIHDFVGRYYYFIIIGGAVLSP